MGLAKLVLPVALLLALTAPALASPPPPPPPPDGASGPHHGMSERFLRQFDLDGDGKVTRAEFDRGSALRFKKIDANLDGVITADELAQYRPDGPPPPGPDGPPPPHPPQGY